MPPRRSRHPPYALTYGEFSQLGKLGSKTSGRRNALSRRAQKSKYLGTMGALRRFFSQLAVALLWSLHFLPPSILAVLGRGLGQVLYYVARRRKNIATTNLAWCFPELPIDQRKALCRDSFRVLGQSMLDRSLLWWGKKEALLKLIKVVGDEKIRALIEAQQPFILLTPHFYGLDAAAVALACRFSAVSIYAPQKNPVFDRLFYRGRKRFGDTLLLTRQESVRTTIKAMKEGRLFYYLPDLNHHRRDSIFVPFFGVPTATITGLSRLARAAGAVVLTCVTRTNTDGHGYVVEIGDPWSDFPTHDARADTIRMNAWLEETIRTMPEQYYWVHRRFKTRPDGEACPY